MPSLPPWNSSQRWSMWALIRPTASPPRSASKNSASACSNQGFLRAVEELAALEAKRRHPLGVVAPEAVRDLDERVEVALARDRVGS